MAQNLGNAFEKKFKEDFLKWKGCTIDRLYDTTSGFYGIKNICDFIGYKKPNIFYLECKSIRGNTFPLTNLKQYDKLLGKQGIEGAITGVILWFIDHDKVCFVPISDVKKAKEANKKSINVKMIGDQEYNIIEIPSIKKRVFMDSDYSILGTLEDKWQK